jgi:hypothetical protein
MGFSSGSVSMRRFVVVGEQPKAIDQAILDSLDANKLAPTEDGVPPDIEYGWSGGRHILDGRFDFEKNVFNDAISFALRVDTNRVPAELRQAYQIIEEEAVAETNPSGFISRKQKKDVKETLSQKIDDELRSGRFRRSKLTPLLWDFPTATIYSPASPSAGEKLVELFERTFGLELMPISAGSLALRSLESHHRRRDYEDLRPTRFVPGDGGESQFPEYPWTSKAAQPKDFLGNEFLLWLWHEADQTDATIKTERGEVTIFIDKSLDLDCAYGQSGRDNLRSTGPTRMPEAMDALRTGKVPRKMGLIFESSGSQHSFTFNAETLAVASAKLPEVEEADTPRVLFEERITQMRDLWGTIDSLFETFLKRRTSPGWESHAGAMRKWILQTAKLAIAEV